MHVIQVKAQAGDRRLNHPGINLIARVLKRRDPFPAVSEAAVTRKGQGDALLLTLRMEEGGPESRGAVHPKKLTQASKQAPLEPPEGDAALRTL